MTIHPQTIPPLTIPYNMLTWLDANNFPTGSTTTWTDKSASKNSPTQATSGARPVCTANQQNGRNGMVFDGVDDHLAVTFPSTVTFPQTMFIVAKMNTVQSSYMVDGIDITNRNASFINTLSTRWSMYAGSQLDTQPIVDTNPHIFSIVFDASNSDTALYIDGLKAKNGDCGSAGLAGLTIGSRYTGVSDFYNGVMFEIIIYHGALPDVQRKYIEQYLSNKWAIDVPVFTQLVSATGFHPAVSFSRSGSATYFDGTQTMQYASTGVARFGSLTGTSATKLGYIPEASSANLCKRSNIDALWAGNASGVITANSVTSPDGTSNAGSLSYAASTVSGTFYGGQGLTLTLGQKYTYSMYVKHISGTSTKIRFGNDSAGWTTGVSFVMVFDTNTQAFSSVGADISSHSVQVLANGWFRIQMTGTAVANTANTSIIIYNGDGSNAGVIGVFGVQVENSSFATSLMPTAGSTASRNADVARISNVNLQTWFNSQQGTFFIKGQRDQCDTFSVMMTMDDGTANNTFELYQESGANSLTFNMINISGGSTNALLSGTTGNANIEIAAACSYKLNAYAICNNDGTVATDTVAALPVGVTDLAIGTQRTGGFNQYQGVIESLVYVGEALTTNQHRILSLGL